MASVGAYAYWSSNGSGSGTAQTGSGGTNLAVNQTSDTGPSFTPGGTGQVLGGNVTSTVAVGGGNVAVTTLVATLAAPTGGSNHPNACTTADYEFTAANGWVISTTNTLNDTATHTYSNIDLAPGASTPWSGLQVDMVDRADANAGDGSGNQDGCQNATLNFAYSAS